MDSNFDCYQFSEMWNHWIGTSLISLPIPGEYVAFAFRSFLQNPETPGFLVVVVANSSGYAQLYPIEPCNGCHPGQLALIPFENGNIIFAFSKATGIDMRLPKADGVVPLSSSDTSSSSSTSSSNSSSGTASNTATSTTTASSVSPTTATSFSTATPTTISTTSTATSKASFSSTSEVTTRTAMQSTATTTTLLLPKKELTIKFSLTNAPSVDALTQMLAEALGLDPSHVNVKLTVSDSAVTATVTVCGDGVQDVSNSELVSLLEELLTNSGYPEATVIIKSNSTTNRNKSSDAKENTILIASLCSAIGAVVIVVVRVAIVAVTKARAKRENKVTSLTTKLEAVEKRQTRLEKQAKENKELEEFAERDEGFADEDIY